MAGRKAKVFWKEDDYLKLYPAFISRIKAGALQSAALDAAQREVLDSDRWRIANHKAVIALRKFADNNPKKVKLAELAANEPTLPDEQAQEPPTPAAETPSGAPVLPEPAPLRVLLTELLVEAGRILIADDQFQEIAIRIGQRFLTEALKPASSSPSVSKETVRENLTPESRARKPKVVVVGLLNGQQGMIEREYGDAIALNFVPKDHVGQQLRDATRNVDAAFVMKFSGHAEWNKVNAVVGENVQVGFMTGLDRLRQALDPYKANGLSIRQ